MKKLLTLLIVGYQVALSPFLGGSCRFYPSCSHYALEALEKHRFKRAIKLILNRLRKCHPWNKGGVDPVPHEK